MSKNTFCSEVAFLKVTGTYKFAIQCITWNLYWCKISGLFLIKDSLLQIVEQSKTASLASEKDSTIIVFSSRKCLVFDFWYGKKTKLVILNRIFGYYFYLTLNFCMTHSSKSRLSFFYFSAIAPSVSFSQTLLAVYLALILFLGKTLRMAFLNQIANNCTLITFCLVAVTH